MGITDLFARYSSLSFLFVYINCVLQVLLVVNVYYFFILRATFEVSSQCDIQCRKDYFDMSRTRIG